jgi:serine/threonine protein phosphatase 1
LVSKPLGDAGRVPLDIARVETLSVHGQAPALAPASRIYAIGDIHGRLDLLDLLLARIVSDLSAHPVDQWIYVFLGDYVDRGPCSRETIDRLIEHGAKNNSVFLKGNHEALLIDCLSDRSLFDRWLRLGGLETLISYGAHLGGEIKAQKVIEMQAALHGALPPAHYRFFRELKSSFTSGDFFFAHAGARPNVELAQQKDSDLLWIRQEFLASDYDFGKIIVHGHTPARQTEIAPNRINIDTGAFATGCLTCLVIEGVHLWTIDTSSAE